VSHSQAGKLPQSEPQRPADGTTAATRTRSAPEPDPDGTVAPTSAQSPAKPDPVSADGRDPAAVRQFIESFTAQLAHAGFPRSAARIFVALLTSDSSSLTAAELAELLHTSPASVSSGARYLVQVGLVTPHGEPGSRRQHYRMGVGVWQDIVRLRDQLFTRWAAELAAGVQVLGPSTPAGERMAETVRYFHFISAEMQGLVDRWAEQSSR